MANNNKYYILTINTGSEYQSFDDMLLHLQDDPKYAKKWPCIGSSDLLKQLENFMSTVVINGFGTENGVLFIKPTRRQVDGSHRYYFCKESPDGKVFLYKKMGAGTNKGKFFKIYTNKEETVDVLPYIINYMKHEGAYPTINDVEQHYEDEQVMIARERIQICLNVVHSGVDITHRKTSIDYAIDLLPEIKAVSTTTTTVVAAEPASQQNNGSLSPRSSLSSSPTAVASPPSNNNDTKPKKRTHAAANNSSSTQINGRPTPMAQRLRGRKQITNDVKSPASNTKISSTTCNTTPQTSNSSSTQINGRPTPMPQRLRGRKKITNDVTSPASNTKVSSTTRDNTPQASTSSSAVNGNRKKKRSSKSTTPTVFNDPEPKKKVKKRRQN